MMSQEHDTAHWKFCTWSSFFTKEQCKEISDFIDDNYSLSGPGEFSAKTSNGESLKQISNVKNIQYGKIKHLISALVDSAFYHAQNKFGYLTNGPFNVEQLNFNTYDSNTKDQYLWHIDESPNSQEDIKLTLLMNLSTENYEGGEFQTYIYDEQNHEEFNQPGGVIMFKSHIHHRVLPVTKGIRKSLAMFITGPRFR